MTRTATGRNRRDDAGRRRCSATFPWRDKLVFRSAETNLRKATGLTLSTCSSNSRKLIFPNLTSRPTRTTPSTTEPIDRNTRRKVIAESLLCPVRLGTEANRRSGQTRNDLQVSVRCSLPRVPRRGEGSSRLRDFSIDSARERADHPSQTETRARFGRRPPCALKPLGRTLSSPGPLPVFRQPHTTPKPEAKAFLDHERESFSQYWEAPKYRTCDRVQPLKGRASWKKPAHCQHSICEGRSGPSQQTPKSILDVGPPYISLLRGPSFRQSGRRTGSRVCPLAIRTHGGGLVLDSPLPKGRYTLVSTPLNTILGELLNRSRPK